MSVPPPQKQASSLTTVSESDHEDDAATVHDEPWFFRILDNAAAFGEVIADHPSSSAGEKEPAEGADVVGLLGRDLARLEIQEPTQANLGGAPKRWVNVCASSWLKRRTHSGLAGSSESDEETDSDRGKPEDDDERLMPEDKLSDEPDSFTASPSTISPSTTPPTEAAPLTPSDKVALIVSEFGALTHGEEVEELLAETDAAFFQDVVILVRFSFFILLLFCLFSSPPDSFIVFYRHTGRAPPHNPPHHVPRVLTQHAPRPRAREGSSARWSSGRGKRKGVAPPPQTVCFCLIVSHLS